MKSHRRRTLRTRRDDNEPEIIAVLEGVGWKVERMDHPVDLMISKAGQTMVIEVKNPAVRPGGGNIGVAATKPGGEFEGMDPRLTPREARFLQSWPGLWAVVDSVESALAAVDVATCRSGG